MQDPDIRKLAAATVAVIFALGLTAGLLTGVIPAADFVRAAGQALGSLFSA